MKRERLFFALWPGPEWQRAYHAAVKRQLQHAHGRWIPAGSIHITLVFLGPLARAQRECLEAAADRIRIAPFVLELTRAVSRPRNKMIWTLPPATPAALIALARQLREAQSQCGMEPERRPFVPHLTLLRNVARPIETQSLDALPDWPIGSFALMRSQTLPAGAVYEMVREWPLQEGSLIG